MDQYVHGSKEASGPVSLRIPSRPQQSPNFLEHLKPHIGRSAKDAKEDVDSCCYWTLLLLLAVWFCLVFISLKFGIATPQLTAIWNFRRLSLRAALPGWLYAAFSLTDTLGYPVWAPSHDAWLLNMVSENFGDAWCMDPNWVFIIIFPYFPYSKIMVLLAVFRHTQRLLPWEVGAKASYNLTGAEAVLLRPVGIGRLEEGRWMMLNRTLLYNTIYFSH